VSAAAASSAGSSILARKDNLPEFRLAIREWLQKVLPPSEDLDRQENLCGRDYAGFEKFQNWWMGELKKVGLWTPHWPVEAGGAGISLKQQIVIAEEMARAGAPRRNMFVITLNHIPATLIPHGTREQIEKYVAGAANGDVWCQGFSEPGAGSDLAGLRTKAERVGDHYVINGQKIWSSMSKHAKLCILLARTDFNVRKHAGISYFVLDMKAPGVEVRPIRQATDRAEFSELFLTDVKIPVADLVGQENKGWTVAQATLASERGLIAFEDTERKRYEMEAVLKSAVQKNAAWLGDAQLSREFARHLATIQGLRRLIRELLEKNEVDHASPTVLPSSIKVVQTELYQQFADLLTRIAGVEGQYFDAGETGVHGIPGDAMHDYLRTFGNTIAGGTNEIQKNIISERGLGMPREK
jgi:alkylation response protein AidB-like acyl-CoA dehydrogenase